MKYLEDTDVVVSESLSLSSVRQESGLVAGDQSAACLAQVIFGQVTPAGCAVRRRRRAG